MDVRQASAALALVALGPAAAHGQGFRQTQTDDYTRYELQAPGSHAFRIVYDVSATTAGVPFYFNAVRAGAEEEVHGVIDLMTGRPLEWHLVMGEEARSLGLLNAGAGGRYIQVVLARPVPQNGQARVRIDKTYVDSASYFSRADRIVFDRSLGIDRNAVVLPPDYELVSVNYPSQVAQEADGRIRVSFMNDGPSAVPYRVEARRLANGTAPPVAARSGSGETESESRPAGARVGYAFSERAFENRDITYFLQQPETNSFRLFHDYTETRPGVSRYLNVVRAGSAVTNPSAILLDTGASLRVETLRGDAIAAANLGVSGVTPETEVVVIHFDPVPDGGSARLRIEETYTDASRYLLAGDELVWDRSFGRARNTVILPEGWYLTASSVPAVVTTLEDGRVQLRFINDRPGNIDVFLKARRR